MTVGSKGLLRHCLSVWRLVSLTLILGLLLSPGVAALPARAEQARQEAELLQNRGFEDGFYAWNGNSTLQLGSGWSPWWIDNPEHDPAYSRPEFRQLTAAASPNRVHGGENAQQWFTLYSSFYAGLYQRVPDVTPEQPYRFSAWTQVWSSVEDEPTDVSTNPANPHLQIGIDPYGNIDPFSADIIWSYEAGMHEVIDGWSQLSVEAVARSSSITVFVRSRPEFANKHNYVFLDDASLQVVLPATPTATPTTPAPTATAPATGTATSTMAPTIEATITLNGTPVASATIERATAVPAATVTGTVGATQTRIAPTSTAAPGGDGATRPPASTAAQIPATATTHAPPAPTDTPVVATTSASPVGQTPVTPTTETSITETRAGPTPDVQTATAQATLAPPTASATSTLALPKSETRPAATRDTVVAMVSPTAPHSTAPPPAAEDDAGLAADRGLLCAVPILVIGLFGLALVVLRRRMI